MFRKMANDKSYKKPNKYILTPVRFVPLTQDLILTKMKNGPNLCLSCDRPTHPQLTCLWSNPVFLHKANRNNYEYYSIPYVSILLDLVEQLDNI